MGPEIEAIAGVKHHEASRLPHAVASSSGLTLVGNIQQGLLQAQGTFQGTASLVSQGPSWPTGLIAPEIGACSKHSSFFAYSPPLSPWQESGTTPALEQFSPAEQCDWGLRNPPLEHGSNDNYCSNSLRAYSRLATVYILIHFTISITMTCTVIIST